MIVNNVFQYLTNKISFDDSNHNLDLWGNCMDELWVDQMNDLVDQLTIATEKLENGDVNSYELGLYVDILEKVKELKDIFLADPKEQEGFFKDLSELNMLDFPTLDNIEYTIGEFCKTYTRAIAAEVKELKNQDIYFPTTCLHGCYIYSCLEEGIKKIEQTLEDITEQASSAVFNEKLHQEFMERLTSLKSQCNFDLDTLRQQKDLIASIFHEKNLSPKMMIHRDSYSIKGYHSKNSSARMSSKSIPTPSKQSKQSNLTPFQLAFFIAAMAVQIFPSVANASYTSMNREEEVDPYTTCYDESSINPSYCKQIEHLKEFQFDDRISKAYVKGYDCDFLRNLAHCTAFDKPCMVYNEAERHLPSDDRFAYHYYQACPQEKPPLGSEASLVQKEFSERSYVAHALEVKAHTTLEGGFHKLLGSNHRAMNEKILQTLDFIGNTTSQWDHIIEPAKRVFNNANQKVSIDGINMRFLQTGWLPSKVNRGGHCTSIIESENYIGVIDAGFKIYQIKDCPSPDLDDMINELNPSMEVYDAKVAKYLNTLEARQLKPLEFRETDNGEVKAFCNDLNNYQSIDEILYCFDDKRSEQDRYLRQIIGIGNCCWKAHQAGIFAIQFIKNLEESRRVGLLSDIHEYPNFSLSDRRYYAQYGLLDAAMTGLQPKDLSKRMKSVYKQLGITEKAEKSAAAKVQSFITDMMKKYIFLTKTDKEIEAEQIQAFVKDVKLPIANIFEETYSEFVELSKEIPNAAVGIFSEYRKNLTEDERNKVPIDETFAPVIT